MLKYGVAVQSTKQTLYFCIQTQQSLIRLSELQTIDRIATLWGTFPTIYTSLHHRVTVKQMKKLSTLEISLTYVVNTGPSDKVIAEKTRLR